MRKLLLAIAVAGLLITGCLIPSLHPLYTDDTLVFDGRLVGTWDGEEGGTWVFEKEGERAYCLTHTSGESSARFDAHLVRLGAGLFMDTFPKGEPPVEDDICKLHIVPAHCFWRVELGDDAVGLSVIDLDWLADMIGEGKVTVRHEEVEGTTVLTASTKELQKFMLDCAKIDEAWSDALELTRQKTGAE